MKDVFGNEIKLDDTVAYVRPAHRTGARLSVGTVVGFVTSEKRPMVHVREKDTGLENWKHLTGIARNSN